MKAALRALCEAADQPKDSEHGSGFDGTGLAALRS